MDQILEFNCRSRVGKTYACIASHCADPATGVRSIRIAVADQGIGIGSLQFVFSAQFQATFPGCWSDLILVAQKRFVKESWIEQILKHPGQDLQNPFEDFSGSD